MNSRTKVYMETSIRRDREEREMSIKGREYGCVMLPVEMSGLPPIPREWVHPDYLAELGTYHVTLKDGLIPGMVTKEQVDEVLADIDFNSASIEIGSVQIYGGDPSRYGVIIGTLKGLGMGRCVAAYHALSTLPHIDISTMYIPHVAFVHVLPQYVEFCHLLIARWTSTSGIISTGGIIGLDDLPRLTGYPIGDPVFSNRDCGVWS